MRDRKDTKYLIFVTILMAVMLTILAFNYLYDDIYGEQQTDSPEHTTSVLTIIHWINIPEEVIKGFEKEYPQVKVKFYRYQKSIYKEALEARIRDGMPIDIIGMQEEDFYGFYEKDLLKDLSDKAFLKSYRQDVRNSVASKTEGGEYAVALSSTYYGIWYNKSLFEKYNILIPETYEELTEVCAQLGRNNERTIIAAGLDERLLIPLKLLGTDKKTLLWEVETGKGRPNLQEELGIEIYDGSMSYQQAFEEFKMGRYAMMASTNESIRMCSLDMENVFVPGVFASPFQDEAGSESTPVVLADNLTGISTKTRKEEESYLFLNYISRADTAKMIAQENSWITTIENTTNLETPYYEEWKNLDESGICDISDIWKDRQRIRVFLERTHEELQSAEEKIKK